MTSNASISPRLVRAVDGAWSAIRERHPDVPGVVITLGSGSAGARGSLKLGHFAACRWQHGDDRLAELFVGGEGLSRGPVPVLGTLLHEGAHGLACTRKIKDTSRNGRYHNTRFRELAGEMGVTVARTGTLGWSETSVPDATAALYPGAVEGLREALVAFRLGDGGGSGRKSNDNGVAARCGCNRRIRVSPAVLEAGPITCGLCGSAFEV